MKRKKVLACLLSCVVGISSMPLPMLNVGADVGENYEAVDSKLELKTDVSKENDLRMWYTKPASKGGNTNDYEMWQRYTLPIGNGDLGGSIYGEIQSERIAISEKTLWTGGPSESRPNYNGGNDESKGQNGKTLNEVKRLFLAGMNEQAANLCNNLTGIAGGVGRGAFQAFGDLYFDFQGITESGASNYERDLDLYTAISTVRFIHNGTTYKREYFLSNPDNVLVAKVSAENGDKLSFDIRFPSKQQGAVNEAQGDTLRVHGAIKDNQLKYAATIKAIPTGGSVVANGDKLTVTGADSVMVLVSAATDYKNDYPTYRTKESDAQLQTRVDNVVAKASEKSYETLKTQHVKDYQEIFSRVDLDLGQVVSTKTTDALLTAYNNKSASEEEKRQIEIMLFQYGRYLTIASSRENSQLPANLQGVWNNRNDPPWSSDYHLNVNLQMNYWPTYSTNMAECAMPLIDYVDKLRKPGRVTAKIYAGIESNEENPENGFMAHTQGGPFGWTNPATSFDWGWSPAGVPWVLQNCFEYYEFTGDKEFLKERIYPMLKEEAVFYDQMLSRNSDGELVSIPAFSPEHGPRTAGNTYEQTLIWQLYQDSIKAAKDLNLDGDKVVQWEKNQADLKGPVEIGDSGQIKEWFEETTLFSIPSQNYDHRHISHMLGVFPGDFISEDTPEFFEAAKVSMNNRTDASTGWGMGQRINTWARLGEGNRAHKLIGDLFRGGIFPNLWDYHAPSYYQIDGNFGYTSGVSEMLQQSNVDFINILPALPSAWHTGAYEGLIARGNFEVSTTWDDMKANHIEILSKNGGKAVVQSDDITFAKITNSKGELVPFEVVKQNRVSFDTQKGETYTISEFPQEEGIATPSGLRVIRTKDNQSVVSWDAHDQEVTYQVYRSFDGTVFEKVADKIVGTSFVDESSYAILGKASYYVIAQDKTSASNRSEVVQEKDLRTLVGFVDDSDANITYQGNWGSWNSEKNNHNGTIKYLENPTGTETATLTFVGTGVQVLTCKNNDRGYFNITIDGVDMGDVDTYASSTQRKAVVYENTQLKSGIHTIVVRATGTKNTSASRSKVELDAIRVINDEERLPESITVATKSGIQTIVKPNSSVAMHALVAPQDSTKKAVTWRVTTTTGAETSLASIDEQGILTVLEESGVVRVHATSTFDSSITNYVDVTIKIGSQVENQIVVDDAVSENGTWKFNPLITYTGAWNVYAGEPQKHHGGTKTVNKTAGESASFTFTGSGIELYAHRHLNFSAAEVFLDGTSKGVFSYSGSASGDAQALVFSFKELENKEHTVRLVSTAREGQGQQNIDVDYFAYYVPQTMVDKVSLQDLIEQASKKNEAAYEEDSYAVFATSYQEAVAMYENQEASEGQVTQAMTKLTQAMENLKEKEIQKPDTTGKKLVSLKTLENRILLSWDAISLADSYQIYQVGTTKTKLAEITDTSYLVTGLSPNTEYTYEVVACNVKGESAFPPFKVKTAAAPDQEAPQIVKGLTFANESKTKIKVTWNHAVDNVGVTGYKVYVDGVLKTTQKENAYLLQDAVFGITYRVQVVAFDEALNESLASLVFVTLKEESLPPEPEIKQGWIPENGTYRYYENDKVVANKWVKDDDGNLRYADASGYLTKGWLSVTLNKYYFDENGIMQTGWKMISNTWYYFETSGIMQTGWKMISNTWYYFEANGVMQTGWLRNQNSWYYLGASGAMQTGWLKDQNSWYYLGASGVMQTGWLRDQNSWYYLGASGAMYTGWLKDQQKWYYLAGNGVMKTGWMKLNQTWYYLSKDGVMKTGWFKEQGSWYYLKEQGAMQTGWMQLKGTWYYLKANGIMATGWTFDGNKTYYLHPVTGAWNGQVRA